MGFKTLGWASKYTHTQTHHFNGHFPGKPVSQLPLEITSFGEKFYGPDAPHDANLKKHLSASTTTP